MGRLGRAALGAAIATLGVKVAHGAGGTVPAPVAKPIPAHQLRDVGSWPPEPPTPVGPLDVVRFGEALAHLCGVSEARLLRRLRMPVPRLLEVAAEAPVDAFLLAALVVDGSGCQARRQERGQVGLLAIPPRMYLRARQAPLPVPRARLQARHLLDPLENLRVGAKLLQMWADRHQSIDARVPGAAHRTAVAHWFWGDRVRSSGGEDRVFTLRRRLLQRYAGSLPPVHEEPDLNLPLASPLDGVPRVATSGLGEPRAGGRWHRGLDITGMVGEPVRAIAGGVVIFAGVDLEGQPRPRPIPPEALNRYRRRRMGAGGIYVCIQHEAPAQVVSCYMHLRRYHVRVGQKVKSAEVIGELGATGVARSVPHLHIEIRHDEQAFDVARALAPFLIPPSATLTHHLVKKRLRAARRASLERVRSTLVTEQ